MSALGARRPRPPPRRRPRGPAGAALRWLPLSALVVSQPARGQGHEWVVGNFAQNCIGACGVYDALCEEDPGIWPANVAHFRPIAGQVDARRNYLHKLAVTEKKDRGTSEFLAEPPTGVCSKGVVPGPAPHNPSVTNGGRCTWQKPGKVQCALAPPRNVRRLCPCRPRAPGTRNGEPCRDKEECLQIVDRFLDHQPRAFGLLQVRAGHGNVGGGPCGARCALPGPCPEGPARCRYDTYDSAMAAIYYTKRGRLGQAKKILDAFIRILYPLDLDKLRPKTRETVYKAGPSVRMLTLLASSYNKAQEPQAGNYEAPFVTDGGVDTGNNAWVALAFAHYAAAADAPCYATVARDILAALQRSACHDKLGGFLGHLAPYRAHYRSTEHNIDMYALSNVLGNHHSMAHAHKFVRSMYGKNREREYNGTYSTGTGGAHHCDHTVPPGTTVAADATFWNLLADADPNETRINEALRFAFRKPGVDRDGKPDTHGLWIEDVDLIWAGGGPPPRLNGTRFSTFGNGVHWENTAGAVMAMVHYQDNYGKGKALDLPRHLQEARDSLKHLLGMYGGVPSSVLGGNYAAWQSGERRTLYPGGTDTGMGWPYLRYLATAPTAWTGLMLLHQAAPSERVHEGANPYAPPEPPVPRDTDTTCLPHDTVLVT